MDKVLFWIIIGSVSAVVLTALLALALYVAALKAFHKIFDRPFPRTPYDKSPLQIKQDTIFGRGKNWFYTNRMDFMDLQITSYDGLKLAAYYKPADDKKSKTLIILVHGWRDHPSDMGAYAQLYLDKVDCHVLIPHLRAHGMSQGKHIGYGLFDSQDLIMWINYMRKHLVGPLKIMIHGRSMGAATALMAAGSKKLPDGVTGIVADSPYDSLENQIQQVIRTRYHIRVKFFMKMISRIAAARIGFPVKRASVIDVAGRIKIPVLMFHGAEDNFVPVQMSEDVYNRMQCPKRLLVVEGAKHVMAYDVAPDQYSSEIGKFMKVCKVIE